VTDQEIKEKLEIALKYATLGWRIVVSNWPLADGTCSCRRPHCNSAGKHPRITNWVRESTTNPDSIRKWLNQWPLANISIVTGGESHIIVLDVDKGGDESMCDLIEKHGQLPLTPNFWTSCLASDPDNNIGGYHLVFEHPGVYVPTRARIAPGIDVRGDGGQIIAPPSRNVKGIYKIDPERSPFEIPAAKLPPWLLTLILSSHENEEEERDQTRFDLHTALQGATQGKRDDTIFRAACKMRDMDVPKDIAYDWCRKAAANCVPPFPEKVAEEKVDWAYNRYTPRVKWDASSFERRNRQPYAPQNQKEWVVPYPLVESPTKELPENIFPGWLEKYIYAVADSIQVRPEMAATMALSCIGAALSRKGIIRIKADWPEPLNLYAVVIAPPGTRKSQTFKEMCGPLFDYQMEMIEIARPEVNRKQVQKDALTLELNQLKKNLAKAEGSTRDALIERIVKIQGDLSGLGDIALPRFITDDVTPEALGTLICQNHGRIALMSADGNGVFVQMSGRYTKAPDVDVYVKGWNGDMKIVDRRSRSTEFIEAPALTINIAVQPEVLRGIGRSAAAKQGFFYRILYCYPNTNVGSRDIDSADIPHEVKNSYVEKMRKILDLPYPETTIDVNSNKPRTLMNVLSFNEDALELFKNYERALEKQRGVELDGHMREWLSKHGGNTARLIGILHVAENIDIVDILDEEGNPGSVWEIPIRAETVDKGVILGQFYIDHTDAAFDEMQSDPIKNDAIRIFNWIRQCHKTTFFKNEAIQALGREGDKTNMVLTYLIERGYIRLKEENVSSMNRDNLEYEVNPSVHEDNFRSET